MLDLIKAFLAKILGLRTLVEQVLDQFAQDNPEFASAIGELKTPLLAAFDEELTESSIFEAVTTAVAELKSGDPGANPNHPGLA